MRVSKAMLKARLAQFAELPAVKATGLVFGFDTNAAGTRVVCGPDKHHGNRYVSPRGTKAETYDWIHAMETGLDIAANGAKFFGVG